MEWRYGSSAQMVGGFSFASDWFGCRSWGGRLESGRRTERLAEPVESAVAEERTKANRTTETIDRSRSGMIAAADRSC